jgi:hypothetical protein
MGSCWHISSNALGCDCNNIAGQREGASSRSSSARSGTADTSFSGGNADWDSSAILSSSDDRSRSHHTRDSRGPASSGCAVTSNNRNATKADRISSDTFHYSGHATGSSSTFIYGRSTHVSSGSRLKNSGRTTRSSSSPISGDGVAAYRNSNTAGSTRGGRKEDWINLPTTYPLDNNTIPNGKGKVIRVI